MSSVWGLFPRGTDFSLTGGNGFQCRPGCALCCYASPAVAPEELEGLREAAPGLPMVRTSPSGFRIPSRGNGGACAALREARCRAYAGRPSPCRTFPIHTHLGLRPQLSLVLSCPGLSLPGILENATPPGSADGEGGLVSELVAVANALRAMPTETFLRRTTRRLEALRATLIRQGRWEEREPLQQVLGSSPPLPGPADFPPRGLPGPDEPLENLPLFFEEGTGVLGLRQGASTYQVLHFNEGGGEENRWEEFSIPHGPPALDEGAQDRLHGYLRYLLRRDQLWFLAYRTLGQERGRSLGEVLRSLLRQAGAEVMIRAEVRARWKGRVDPVLGASAVEEGIRAYDADWLDQPTFGTAL